MPKAAFHSPFIISQFTIFPLSSHGLEARLAPRAPTALFAGLFVIGHALDVFGQTFFLAQLLKPPEHLFGGLVAARLHPDHAIGPFSRIINNLSR
jgi:hypothetical protein